MSVLDVEAASKNQQPVRTRAHVKMQDQRGLIQLCKAGLTFENQPTELTTSTEQEKKHIINSKDAEKHLIKFKALS